MNYMCPDSVSSGTQKETLDSHLQGQILSGRAFCSHNAQDVIIARDGILKKQTQNQPCVSVSSILLDSFFLAMMILSSLPCTLSGSFA